MKFGVPISFALHALVLSGGVFLFRNPPPLDAERLIVPVDIISVAEETNIRAAIKRPKEEPIPEVERAVTETPLDNAPEVAPPETPQETPQETVVNEPTPTIVPTPPEPTIDDTQQDAAEAESVETPTQDVAEEPPAFSLDNLSALIDRSRDSQPEANQQKILQSEETLYAFADVSRRGVGAGDALALSEIDALRAAMYKCWRIPVDAKDPESLIIPVDVSLHRDGHVASVKLKNAAAINSSSNPFMKIAADNALRAVSKCAPYDFLPVERYDSWKQMALTFRPVLSQ